MALARTCSECGVPLVSRSPRAKTCSEKCRSARSRRERRVSTERATLDAKPGVRQIAEFVRNEAPDIAKNVLSQELAPIVRQALTEDVLRAIDKLVGLTPAAVNALTEDLMGDDKVLRQRAYTLLFKYTTGHPALVKPEDTEDKSQLVVNFNLPRPDPEQSIEPTAAVELRTCDLCKQEKAVTEFEAGSERCTDCFEEWKAKIREQFA